MRTQHDALYKSAAFPREADRLALEARALPDRFRLHDGADASYDPEARNRNVRGSVCARRDAAAAAPASSFLRALHARLAASGALELIDQEVDAIARRIHLVENIVPARQAEDGFETHHNLSGPLDLVILEQRERQVHRGIASTCIAAGFGT